MGSSYFIFNIDLDRILSKVVKNYETINCKFHCNNDFTKCNCIHLYQITKNLIESAIL